MVGRLGRDPGHPPDRGTRHGRHRVHPDGAHGATRTEWCHRLSDGDGDRYELDRVLCYLRPMAHQDIKAVVFDIGGVLLDWDPRHLYRKLIADPDEMAAFLGGICTPRWHRAHDLGADTEQSCRELAAAHPSLAAEIMAWSHRSEEMIAGEIEEGVHVLAELKASGMVCLALSNMEPDKFALRRSRYPFFRHFDGCVISGIEGMAKPDRRIFEMLLSRYDL